MTEENQAALVLIASAVFSRLENDRSSLMRIESPRASISTLQQQRREQDEHVQGVFSKVLGAVDRDGYRSAAQVNSGPETVSGQRDLDDKIQHSWDDWYRTESLGRYRSAENRDAMGSEFGDLLVRAHQAGGYADPKGFLNTLSSEQLDVVRRVHWLADSINVNSLSEEGALNLLIPPAAQVDLNGDGITQSGLANGIRFPDSTTPTAVAQAWYEATDGMDWGERAIHELQMKLPVLLANLSFNEDGSLAHARQVGDADWQNPMADPNYSFVQAAQDWLEYLDYFKSQIDPARYQADTAFWKDFQNRLAEHRE
jgi:hypothetical protein